MVCPCFGARRDGRAQSRGFGRAGARPRRRFAHRSARLGVFRSTLCAKCDGHNALAGAHRPPCDPPARSSLSSFSTPRAAFPRRLRRARGGAMCSWARPRCRSPGRSRDSAPACDRLRFCGTRSGSPTSSSLSRSGRLSAPGPLQVFVGPPDSSPMTSFALAHHSGLSRALSHVPARRDLRPPGRQRGADAQLAKRASGESGVTGSHVAGAPRERRRRANLAILPAPSRSDSTEQQCRSSWRPHQEIDQWTSPTCPIRCTPRPPKRSAERPPPKLGSPAASASDTTHEVAPSRRPTRR